MSKLTNKQAAFVEEYLVDFNATKAAERAGYRGNYASLAATGSRLLKNVKIRERISARLAESAMSADEVLGRLGEQARADITDFVTIGKDENGATKVTIEIPPDKSHLVKSIKQTRDGLQIELHDVQAALALLGKHHRLFTERRELSGPDGKPLVQPVVIYMPDNDRKDRD